jgi:rifampicin phosphotransferase
MEIRWDPPGPGQWASDRSHMPPGCTPIVQHVSTTSMGAGMRRTFAEFGTPLDTIDARFVNGQFYTRLRPLVMPDRVSTKLPPKPVLKLAMRLHPEMRRRNATAGRVIDQRPWIQVIDDWHAHAKAQIVASNLAIQDVELTALDDASALGHLHRALAHCIEMWEHHFWLHGHDLGPLGQYLSEALDVGVPAIDALSLLEGASPSTSAPTRELCRIRALVEASGREPSSLAELRSISSEIDTRVDEYLRHRGAVLFSRYDVDGVTLAERPDLVFATIMNAEVHDSSAEVAARIASVRETVPSEHRPRFDELLQVARAAMDLRDDNGPTTAEWPAGLLRLALLEIGRRLAERDLIDRPELVFELQVSELTMDLFGGHPANDELERRAAVRAHQKTLTAPPLLGPAEAEAPLDVLPPNLARIAGMVQTIMEHLGMDGHPSDSGLQGAGIGTNTVQGRARVAASAEEALDLLEPGDILVVAGTTPAYNLVLSMAGGVITAGGGPMSHAAVIARELGIPAIIGARGALTDIPNGASVEIDPVAGVVRILAAP